MKKIALLIIMTFAAFLPQLTTAKEKVVATPLQCDTVIQAQGLTAEQIYTNLNVWFADNMRSANAVIQLDDKENCHIIGKTSLPFEVNHFTWAYLTGLIHYTIDVAARDGRFKVVIRDFIHESNTKGWSEGLVFDGGHNPEVKGMRKHQNAEMNKRASKLCKEYIPIIIKTMQTAVAGKSTVTEEDW